jgi:hypothetical protein
MNMVDVLYARMNIEFSGSFVLNSKSCSPNKIYPLWAKLCTHNSYAEAMTPSVSECVCIWI